MTKIIVYDIGGSGGKVTLLDFHEGLLQAKVLNHFAHHAYPIGENLFWDILNIYNQLKTGLLAGIDLTNDQIDSLGIDSFCNDFGIVSPDGALLTQVHSYRDIRTEKYESEIYKQISPYDLYFMTGNQNAPFNAWMQIASLVLSKKRYLLEHGNQLMFIPDLLSYFLTNIRRTEYTLASVSQMFDPKKKTWLTKPFELLNISQSIFPAIQFPGTRIGKTSTEINQQLSTKGFWLTTVCGHDSACAFIGSFSSFNRPVISCGTWAIIGVESPDLCITDESFQFNLANEGGLESHRLIKNVMGTWILQELLRQFPDITFSSLESMASSIQDELPWIDVDDMSFYNPPDMSDALKKYYFSQYGKAPKTVGEIARSIYESLAFKFRYNIEKISCLTNRKFDSVNLVGGGAKSRLLCQITADMLGLPVLTGPIEATTLGNAVVQLIACNQLASVQEGREMIRKSFPPETILPDQEKHAYYEKRYQSFKATRDLSPQKERNFI